MQNLKLLMEQNKESSQALGTFLNISQPTISRYLSGKTEPPIEVLIKIADHYGVTVDYLIGHPTKSGLPLTMYTSNQQQLIAMIKDLNDIQCFKLFGFIEGMLGKEYIPPKQENFF